MAENQTGELVAVQFRVVLGLGSKPIISPVVGRRLPVPKLSSYNPAFHCEECDGGVVEVRMDQ
ncbi:hypothetical protein CH63R_09070 [Colletotrichum higginsianum IMI 349063]|uniref:Uncharacterized protein n=1 Tax=Colletotrichum higginsianum (strain IMI 349063) TaxID=759273 RepID=A0A1B7Y671_COLHI|nr:hypothetical protein CH63R_09070 [Colletotrichum higginsianum IMI 349063]OBR07549.1 hypothetical protein CH63R_09070 [Colletotrichum higginsianum IMI 349063]